KNLTELDSQLAAHKACSRLAVEGGWYAVLRVPATRSDEDLAIELLDQLDVYVHPGHFYGFPSDGYLIVSLIAGELEFVQGIRRLLNYVNLEANRRRAFFACSHGLARRHSLTAYRDFRYSTRSFFSSSVSPSPKRSL